MGNKQSTAEYESATETSSISKPKPYMDTRIPVFFNKKMYIVIDFYFKSKINNSINLDVLKNNHELKTHVKDIILSAFNKVVCKAHISDTNLLFVLKRKNNHDYLELNTVADLSSDVRNSEYNKGPNDISIQGIKMAIVTELYTYMSKECGIVVSPTETLVILYNTLYNVEVYQKP